jgi:hypothetical protein
MMEHLAHMAAEAESEQEAAEHFLPLIGLAASKLLPVVAKAVLPAAKKALPHVARAVTRVQPALTKGIGKVTRALHRNPATRPLIRAVPAIARRTVYRVARQAATGRPVTPQSAVRTFATQARTVLGSAPRRKIAMRRSTALDRRFHTQMGPAMVRPHAGVATGGGRAPAPGIPAPGVRPGAAAGYRRCATCGAVRPSAREPVYVSRPAGCPACPGQTASVPAPAYCRCCGQIIR